MFRNILKWWPTICGILLGLYLAGCIGCMTIHHQPISLNLYKMPPMDDGEQTDDCTQYDTQELICDMGLNI